MTTVPRRPLPAACRRVPPTTWTRPDAVLRSSQNIREIDDTGERVAIQDTFADLVGMNQDRQGRAMPRQTQPLQFLLHFLLDLTGNAIAAVPHLAHVDITKCTLHQFGDRFWSQEIFHQSVKLTIW